LNFFRHPARWLLFIRIACLAILMNALAPSVSHLLASARSDLFTSSLCITDPTGKSAGGKTMAMEECGYCLPHAGSNGLLPVMFSGLGLTANHGLRPFLFYRAPKPLLALTAAPPRGPPSIA
jgi:hypothetical protein